jgi:NAD+ kinase
MRLATTQSATDPLARSFVPMPVARPLQLESGRPGESPYHDRMAFVANQTSEAQAALARLTDVYGSCALPRAKAIIALGGDGLMLRTLHQHMGDGIPLFGMNRGSVGFLTNEYREDGLTGRLEKAELSTVHPLRMVAHDAGGETHEALAINEVSVFRSSHQAGKLRVSVDGHVRLSELICDGILLASPVGSTAYNLSVGGPILPLNAPLLALTPISPFRPRRWRGAILTERAQIRIEVLEAGKRPMSAVANQREFRSVTDITIGIMRDVGLHMLFDPGHALDERILSEQFEIG